MEFAMFWFLGSVIVFVLTSIFIKKLSKKITIGDLILNLIVSLIFSYFFIVILIIIICGEKISKWKIWNKKIF